MRRALVCWLLLASAAFAQAPSVVVKPRARPVPSGGDFTLDATASVSSQPLVWKSFPPLLTRVVDEPGKQRFATFIEPPDGTYTIVVVGQGTAEDGKTSIVAVEAVTQVVGAAPTPPPAPSPGPQPGPPPAPDDGKPAPGPVNPLPAAYSGPLIVTLVYEPAAMTPALASLKDSVAIPAALKSLDARYMTLATTVNGSPSVEYARRGLAPVVSSLGGLPAVVFQDPTGKVIHKVAAPADESGVVAALQQLRGGK